MGWVRPLGEARGAVAGDGVGQVATCGMDRHARGLVEDDEKFVLVEDGYLGKRRLRVSLTQDGEAEPLRRQRGGLERAARWADQRAGDDLLDLCP